MVQNSYDKVSQLYCETKIWKDYADLVRDRLNDLHVSTFGWDVRADPKNPSPYFRCKHRFMDKEHSIWRSERPEILRFQVDWDWVVDDDDLTAITKRIWDTHEVPTYNCKLDRTRDGVDTYGKKRKAPKEQEYLLKRFPHYARNIWLREKLEDLHKTVSDRIRTTIMDWYDSPEFESRKKVAIERAAVDEIKYALMRYRHLNESVLKTAFKEFIVSSVLDE